MPRQPTKPQGESRNGASAKPSSKPIRLYRIHVSYARLPGIEALERKYSGKASVSRLYDGRAWERHPSCVSIDETPGERIFWVDEVPEPYGGKPLREIWNKLATYYRKKGFRFAIEKEADAFADAMPNLQLQHWIRAIGVSATHDDGRECTPMLLAGGQHRMLGGGMIDCVLPAHRRLLLVRLPTSKKLAAAA